VNFSPPRREFLLKKWRKLAFSRALLTFGCSPGLLLEINRSFISL
jgi:hypothetical protein